MILKVGYTRWDAYKFQWQRLIITHELAAHGGNVAETARSLGLRSTYVFRLKKDCGLPADYGRP